MPTSTSNTIPKILAIGAAGKFAGMVIPELAKRGAKVRGLVHHAEQADEVTKNGAVEAIVGDLSDRSCLDTAMKGMHSVFYIAPAAMPNEVEVGE